MGGKYKVSLIYINGTQEQNGWRANEAADWICSNLFPHSDGDDETHAEFDHFNAYTWYAAIYYSNAPLNAGTQARLFATCHPDAIMIDKMHAFKHTMFYERKAAAQIALELVPEHGIFYENCRLDRNDSLKFPWKVVFTTRRRITAEEEAQFTYDAANFNEEVTG